MTLQRKTKVNKVKKTSRASLVRKLDKLTSEFIRQREKSCVVCGSTKNLTNGHLFSRVAYSLRWDITEDGNCHTQCLSCNLKHEYDSYPYTSWYIKTFGQDKYDELHRQYVKVNKLKNYQLEAMIAGIESLLNPKREKDDGN